jgi:hypothetical protein
MLRNEFVVIRITHHMLGWRALMKTVSIITADVDVVANVKP